MPKPLRRIGASTLATVSERLSPQTLQVGLPGLRVQPLSTHVIERPSAGVVLTIASGSRAGEMIGTDDHEVLVGFTHDCLLRFSNEQYPLATGKLLLRRGPEGWYVLRVSGGSAFINQRALTDKCALRSGDIIRLSSRGPDVQFSMHSGGMAIRALADRYLPSPSATAQAVGEPSAEAGRNAAPQTSDQPPNAPADATAAEVSAAELSASKTSASQTPRVEFSAAEFAGDARAPAKIAIWVAVLTLLFVVAVATAAWWARLL